MTATSTTIAACKPEARSRVSNGKALFLSKIDGRSLVARRFRDILAAIVSDLGGPDQMSEGQRQLARRAASLSVQSELAEADMARGDAVGLDDYVRGVNALCRTLGALGLERRARNVTPTLRELLSADTPPHATAAPQRGDS